MIPAPIPENETARINALYNLNILDTPAEERYDRITRLARRLFNVPVALISIIDTDRQWFKSVQGLNIKETPRDISFCGHAIMQQEPLVVEDALQDKRFHDNPLVVKDPKIRFYAGQPLMNAAGMKVGTLCLIDHTPRKITEEELQLLKDLAIMVEKEMLAIELNASRTGLMLELQMAQRQAMLDPLTQTWNRKGIEELLQREMTRAKRQHLPIGIAMIDVDNYKSINDTYGHPVGDTFINEFAQRLRNAIREYDTLGRYGGDEFIIVMPDCTKEAVKLIAARILSRIRSVPFRIDNNNISVTTSIGLAHNDKLENLNQDLIIKMADQALYTSKKSGKNQANIA